MRTLKSVAFAVLSKLTTTTMNVLAVGLFCALFLMSGTSEADQKGINHGQVSWTTSTSANNTFTTLTGSSLTASTKGGDLLININIFARTMSNFETGQHITCQPIIDGVWAGSYGGLPNPGDLWREGLTCTGCDINGRGNNWTTFAISRMYPAVPAGTHTFAVQCLANEFFGQFCDNNVGCSMNFIELPSSNNGEHD